MKTVYGSIHMSPGVVTFTDEFLARCKALQSLVQAHSDSMDDNDLWSEEMLVNVHYGHGTKGSREPLARYLSCGCSELADTSVFVSITKEGSFPYSYHEEGRDSVMGMNGPSLEDAPNVFFSEDFIENGAYVSHGIELMCRYGEVGALLKAMPPDHLALFDQAVAREVSANFSKYRDMWLESFRIIASTEIEELREGNGYVSVAYDPASASDDLLAAMKGVLEEARAPHPERMAGLELFALTSMPDRDALEDKCRIHGLRFNHCALGLDPGGKAQWCKAKGVKLCLDHDDGVRNALEGTSTKFMSMRARPEVPAEHVVRG